MGLTLAFAALLLVFTSTAFGARAYDSQVTEANGTAFTSPFGLTVDGSDDLWVSDTGSSLVSKFDSTGTYLAQNDGTGSWGTSTYNQDLAFGNAAGLIYAADSNADDLWGLNLNATYAGVDLNGGLLGGGCCFIRAAVDNSGNANDGDIYVGGVNNAVVRITGSGAASDFSAAAAYISANTLTGTSDHAFLSVNDVAVDTNGDVYVADGGSGEVDRFDSTGTFVQAYTGSFGSLSSVAVDPTNGNVLIGDSSLGVVHEFDSSGSFIDDTDGTGTPAGSFSPQGLAIDSTGVLYVSDASNPVVDVFGSAGPPPVKHTLAVSSSGAGTGTVTSAPGGLNCGATCTHDFNENSTVTLTATPAVHSSFAGWTVDGDVNACPGTGTCAVPVGTTDHTVVANFDAIPQQNVDVSFTGAGTGSVSSSPDGIDCGATCTSTFDQNSTTTFTANPTTGFAFTGWTIDGDANACPGTGTCDVAIGTTDHTVVANFEVATHTLTVSKAGTGGGSVTSAPAGIDCGATCSSIFDETSTVTLTATPATGSTFVGWTGPGAASCPGTGTCAVTIPGSNTSVTATFTQTKPTVTTTAGATSITQHTATVAGTVTPNSGNVTNCHIDYGKTTSYGTQAPCSPASPGAGASAVGVSAALSGLTVGTTYHFRVVATNAGGTTNGSDQTFATLADTCATNAVLCPPPPVPTCATDPSLCPAPKPGVLKLDKATATVPASGKAPVVLSCKGETACSDDLKLTLKVKVRKGKKTVTKTLTLGKVSVDIAAGGSKTVKVQLSRAARKLLAKKHHFKATLAGDDLKKVEITLKEQPKK